MGTINFKILLYQMRSFIASMVTAVAFAVPDVAWESIGHFKLNKAAFPNISQFGDSEPFLLCSSFKAFGSGSVFVVPDVSEAVQAGDVSTLEPVKLDTHGFEFQWPNDVKVIPEEVFGFRAIIVPDGFLVPGHANGGLYIMRMDDTDLTKTEFVVKISEELDGYFYHMGEWLDLNGDGRLDFLTARSNAAPGGGQLVWFEHPEEGLTGATWKEHVVTAGPDVGIQVIQDSPYRHEVVVFAAEFFNENVSFYRVSTKDGSLIESRMLDDSILSAYSVTFADLNGDGVRELMVNNHEKDENTNGIWAYEQPKDWMTGDWTKQTLARDFKNAFSITVPGMAPGFPYPFYPEVQQEHHIGNPAHILVAGDGDFTAWIMTPEDMSNWEWERDVLTKPKGTVGALTFADLDHDGWNEVWVPDYDHSKIEVFRFFDEKQRMIMQ